MGSQEGWWREVRVGDAGYGCALNPTGCSTIWSLGIVEQEHLCWIPPSLGRPEGTWGRGRLEEDDSFVTGKGLVFFCASLDSLLSLPSSAQGSW